MEENRLKILKSKMVKQKTLKKGILPIFLIAGFLLIIIATSIGAGASNDAPVIKPVEDAQKINEREYYRYDVNAYGKNIVWSLVGDTPNWLVINSTYGVVSGVAPGVGGHSSKYVTVKAENKYGYDIVTYRLVIRNLPECSDNFDNDGDGLTDMDDPGCKNPEDNNENARCSDGWDNDGDGLTDMDDPGCSGPGDDHEDTDRQIEEPSPEGKFTIKATKIVCEDESDLPDWSYNSVDIDASTATNYVSQNPGCHLQTNWEFQWDIDPVISTDEEGYLPGWETFGPTNAQGVASVEINLTELDGAEQNRVWVREVFPEGYLEFSGYNSLDDVSAEMYCHTDVQEYDNADYVENPEQGETYYCVAFNVELEEPPVEENNPPVITSSPITQVDENTQYDYGVNANDADGDTLTYSLLQKPSWLSIDSNTGLITGTTPSVNSDTDYTVKVKVVDGEGGEDTQTYILTVKNVEEPPVNNNPEIVSSPVKNVYENQIYSYDVNANDADGDTLTYSLLQKPSWLSIDSNTGLITGTTPEVVSNTNYTIQSKVTDGNGGEDTQTYILTVKNVEEQENNPPVITSTPSTVVDEGDLYTYQVFANDPDNDTLTYLLTEAPGWLTINSNTGHVSGNAPKVSSEVDFNVTIKVSDGQGGSDTQSYVLTVDNENKDDDDDDDDDKDEKNFKYLKYFDSEKTTEKTFDYRPTGKLVLGTPILADEDCGWLCWLAWILFIIMILLLIAVVVSLVR